MREFIRHSYENVPYYNRLFKDLKLIPADIKTTDDLVKLPILTKEIIRENFKNGRIIAKNIPKKDLMLRGSSGSTGQPLQYYITKEAYSMAIAANLRGWSWMGYRLGDKYIKLSTNPRQVFVKRFQDKINNCDYIHSKSFTKTDIRNIVNHFRISNVKFIRGYPAALYILSKYIKENNIDDIKPIAINTTSEPLFPNMRKVIEKQFNCQIFDSYSAEGGPVVFECNSHKSYHISSEYGFMEFVRDNSRVTEGKAEIVSTDLTNYAMPFIRYRVKDVATLDFKKCTCGRGLPTLSKIEGRDTDILVTPSGKQLTFYFFAGYFEWVKSVDMFQFAQNGINEIRLKLVPNERFNDKERAKIEKDMSDHIGNEMKLFIQIVDKIPLTSSGKRRFFIRNKKIKLDI